MPINEQYEIDDFQNNKVNISKLYDEIKFDLGITSELLYIDRTSDNVNIYFGTTLTQDEKTNLNNIITDHDYEILNDVVEPSEANTEILNSTIKNNYVLEGGYIWKDNYDFCLANTKYIINNKIYTINSEVISLDSPDNTYDRYDSLTLGITGNINILKGTASATPVPPTINEITHLRLGDILVETGTTKPTNITNQNIYLGVSGENTGWVVSTNSLNIDINNTTDVHYGDKNILFNQVSNNDYVEFTNSDFDISEMNVFVFHLKLDKLLPSNSLIKIYLDDKYVLLLEGKYGLDRTNITDYQPIIIDLSLFNLTSISSVKIKILEEKDPDIKFKIDSIFFQKITTSEPSPASNSSQTFNNLGNGENIYKNKNNNIVNLRTLNSTDEKIELSTSTNSINFKINDQNITFGSENKGDIPVYLGTTMSKLSSGTAEQVIFNQPSAATGLEWKYPFGSFYSYVSSVGESSTTSSTYQTKATLNITSIPSGTYRVGISYNIKANSASKSLEVQVLFNSTQIYHTLQEVKDTTDILQHSGFVVGPLTAGGPHTVTLQYRRESGGFASTITISNVYMEFYRVSD